MIKIPTFVLHWDGQTFSTVMTKLFLFREYILICALLFNILEAIYKGETSKTVASYCLELLIEGQRSPTILFTFQQTVLVLTSMWQFCLSTQ